MALHFSGEVENNSGEFELVTPNTYEVVLNCEWKKTKSGDGYINCSFKIRKDVKQDFGGRIIFDGIYKTKKSGALQESKINAILSTVTDAKHDFEDYDELIQYMNDLEMQVDVDIEPADPSNPNSKERNIIKYCSYKPSCIVDEESSEAKEIEEAQEKIEAVNNDDFPF